MMLHHSRFARKDKPHSLEMLQNAHGFRWKKVTIAVEIGCSAKSLCKKRAPRFHCAWEAYRQRDLPHGTKDSEGNLEAW